MDAVSRSIGRARSVETPDHLADASRDAYMLAVAYKELGAEADRLRRYKVRVQQAMRDLRD